jgi:hypothetical protein
MIEELIWAGNGFVGHGGVLCSRQRRPAQELFPLFGGFGPRVYHAILRPRTVVLRAQATRYGAANYCVRSCDGRYFPVNGPDKQSRAEACNSFCPASDTKLVYGSSIDAAATETGKPYSELPNAFRYREELVAGCTCNGKDQIGLAPVQIEDDPTLRRGDIVAAADGLMVVGRGADRGAALSFSPRLSACASSGVRRWWLRNKANSGWRSRHSVREPSPVENANSGSNNGTRRDMPRWAH